MERDKLEQKMENLKIPENLNDPNFKQAFHLTLLSTKKSLRIGIWLTLLPLLFLFGVIIENNTSVRFGINSGLDWLMPRQSTPIYVRVILMLIFIAGLPIIATVLNFASLLSVYYDRKLKEIAVTLKIKWLNISIVVLSSLTWMFYILHLLTDRA
jgi:hypothetical protein